MKILIIIFTCLIIGVLASILWGLINSIINSTYPEPSEELFDENGEIKNNS